MDLTSIPADIWQDNIFPYLEKPDFLNLILSNKKVYNHLQSKKRTKTYSNNPLWDIFYTKCIKEIEGFMDDTFKSIKKTIVFPMIDEYQEIRTLAEILRYTREFVPRNQKFAERRLKMDVIEFLKSPKFIDSYDTLSTCLYDDVFLLFGSMTRDFYHGKRKLDIHINKLVNGMKLKGMDDPRTFLHLHSNSMKIEYDGNQQYIRNILLDDNVDRRKLRARYDHSKYRHNERRLSFVNMYSLDFIRYYDPTMPSAETNIQIVMIFEKILSKLFKDLDFKKVVPIGESQLVEYPMPKNAFIFSVRESKTSNKRIELYVFCERHNVYVQSSKYFTDEDKDYFKIQYRDVIKKELLRNMVSTFEFSLTSPSRVSIYLNRVQNRYFMPLPPRHIMEACTFTKDEASKYMLLAAPLYDMFIEAFPNTDFSFDNIKICIDRETEETYLKLHKPGSEFYYLTEMHLSFFVDYPKKCSVDDGLVLEETGFLEEYPAVKEWVIDYLYLVLNVNFKVDNKLF